jgi:hypothetical protein
MYRVVGLNEKEIVVTETFTEALKVLHEHCSDEFTQKKTHQRSDTSCYIEAEGKIATARMLYPYVFEFAIKVGLIKDGKLTDPLIEPKTTELIAAFSRAAILQMTSGMGCH